MPPANRSKTRATTQKAKTRTQMTPSKAAELQVEVQSDASFGPMVVWYRLYTLADLLSRPHLYKLSRPLPLTNNDWRVLVTLAYNPGIAARDVCRITGITPMNVSRSVASHTRHGRVQYIRDPNNKVRKCLSLTPKGLLLYQEIMPIIKNASKLLLADMTVNEVSALTYLIERMIARIETLEGLNRSS